MKILNAYLTLKYLRPHAGVDTDEDDPVRVLGVGDDERPAPLSDVDATSVLQRHGVTHLYGTKVDRLREARRT